MGKIFWFMNFKKLNRWWFKNFLVNFIFWLLISLPLSFFVNDKLNQEIILNQLVIGVIVATLFASLTTTPKKNKA